MLGRKLMSFLRDGSRGLTLAELLVALLIGSMVVTGAGMTVRQLFLTGEQNEDYMVAVRQVQDAGYWISRDAVMAQNIVPDGGATGFPLTLSWANWETGIVTKVVYTLTGGTIRRQQTIDGQTTEYAVARHISAAKAEYPAVEGFASEDVLKLTVTAEVGRASETRTYKVEPRATD